MHRAVKSLASLLFIASTAHASPPITKVEALAAQQSLAAICPLLEEETFLVISIAEERKNPAHVIDLRKLHDLGEELALTRHAIVYIRKEYADGLKIVRRIIHKAPDTAFCKSWAEAGGAVMDPDD